MAGLKQKRSEFPIKRKTPHEIFASDRHRANLWQLIRLWNGLTQKLDLRNTNLPLAIALHLACNRPNSAPGAVEDDLHGATLRAMQDDEMFRLVADCD